jgi:hypothetical protein
MNQSPLSGGERARERGVALGLKSKVTGSNDVDF